MGSGGIPPLGPPVQQRTLAFRERSGIQKSEARNQNFDFPFPASKRPDARGHKRHQIDFTRDKRVPAFLPGMERRVLKRIKCYDRAIRTSKLNALLRLHTWPIDGVVFPGSQAKPGFEVSFPLRCFQRLSRPYLATRLCGWRHDRSTRGTFNPVLSY